MSERTVKHDIDDLLQAGEQVIFAVDQAPFEVDTRGVKHTFCLLVPLLTEGGGEIVLDQFRNRGRVWWMLRNDLRPSMVRVGMLWSGPIERSREHGSEDPEKDHYQVRRADVQRGARHFVEVLNIPVAHPDLNDLLSHDGIAWPCPPFSRVVVGGALSVLGPFRTAYDYALQRVRLTAITPGDPHVFRLPRKTFEQEAKVHEFSYTANQWDAKAERKKIQIALIHERSMAVLEDRGERLDAASEAQVVRWALELLGIQRRDSQLFKGILASAGDLDQRLKPSEFPGRLQRFVGLCKNRDRVINLGVEVAEAIASLEPFRDLVSAHIEKATAEAVARRIEDRSAEIEAATEGAEARLARAQKKMDNLEEEYTLRLEAWEQQFEQQFKERSAERIRQLEEREAAVERQEKEVLERLQGLVEIYRSESAAFGDRLLAQIPILRRLGILEAGARADGGVAPQRSALKLPAFLEESRPQNRVREEDFLSHLESVVAFRGFVFEREDLINFHVLVLTNMWAVLAGPSGLGKSSLPRLYAEALGCAEEFLLVPVRPDWLDDSELLGGFNALSERYEPAACGLVERLIAAAEDERKSRGGIYIICLDEMNLARVEHYFAQFLSLLEQPPERRHIELFAQGLAGPGDAYERHRKLRLGRNLRLVGTVNVDETTHFFSPKVIDRVPIAVFERPDLRLGLATAARPQALRSLDPVHLEDYLSWMRPPDTEGEVVDLLVKVDAALRHSRRGLGFRLRDRALRYVAGARPFLGEDRALDLALFQNVVPILRPTAPRYPELLDELRSLLPPGRFPRTAEFLGVLKEEPESDFFQLL